MQFINSFFIKVVDMSIISSAMILLVLILRFLLKKESKLYSYLLWSVVLINLILPAFISNPFSVISRSPSSIIMGDMFIDGGIKAQAVQGEQSKSTVISEELKTYDFGENSERTQSSDELRINSKNLEKFEIRESNSNESHINSGKEVAFGRADKSEKILNSDKVMASEQTKEHKFLKGLIGSGNRSLENIIFYLALIWLLGFTVFIVYSIFSYFHIKSKLKNSKMKEKGIYYNESVNSAFVFGLINPKIYISNKLIEQEENLIILHEKTHIKRFDYIIRILAYFALSLHWFNPFVHLAYHLSDRDMEFSCDEAVIEKLEKEDRLIYSQSLLDYSSGKSSLKMLPVAFGDGDIKGRIKNMLNYRKPKLWMTVLLISLILIIVGACTGKSSQNTSSNASSDSSDELSSKTSSEISGEESTNSSNNLNVEEAADVSDDSKNKSPEEFALEAIKNRIRRISLETSSVDSIEDLFDIELRKFKKIETYDGFDMLDYANYTVFELEYKFKDKGDELKLEEINIPPDLAIKDDEIISNFDDFTSYLILLEDKNGQSHLLPGDGLIFLSKEELEPSVNNTAIEVLRGCIKYKLISRQIAMDVVSPKEVLAALHMDMVYRYKHYAMSADYGSGINIIDSEKSDLNLIGVYEDIIKDQKFKIYAYDIKVKPEDISKVIFAGGMIAKDGWITNHSSLGKSAFVIRESHNMYDYIGLIHEQDGAYDQDKTNGHQRRALIELLGRKGLLDEKLDEKLDGAELAITDEDFDKYLKIITLSDEVKNFQLHSSNEKINKYSDSIIERARQAIVQECTAFDLMKILSSNSDIAFMDEVVSKAVLYKINQVNTEAASLYENRVVYTVESRFELSEEAEKHLDWFNLVKDSDMDGDYYEIDYSKYWRMLGGKTYIIAIIKGDNNQNGEENFTVDIHVMSEKNIKDKYNNEEILEKYGDVYTAAAMLCDK